MEAPVSVLHFDMVRNGGLLMDVWVRHARSKALKLDLLGEATCTAHNRGEKASVTNFP